MVTTLPKVTNHRVCLGPCTDKYIRPEGNAAMYRVSLLINVYTVHEKIGIATDNQEINRSRSDDQGGGQNL